MKLDHVALLCSSEQKADDFYQGILGLRKMKSAVLPSELSRQIFGLDLECPLLLYGNDQMKVEVFVADPPYERGLRVEHICLEVDDRETFMKKCQGSNVAVNLVPKGDRLLLFIEDFDGNLFEIKEQ
jgi:catechol 2,3-dioxygenase-like lactoylglutathione lyase family enzyme